MTETITTYSVETELTELEQLNLKVAAIFRFLEREVLC